MPEDLQIDLLTKFTKIMVHSQALESSHLDNLKSRVAAAETAFNAIAPSQDQNMFIDHNIRSFFAPPDFAFEPCGIYYDTVRWNFSMDVDLWA